MIEFMKQPARVRAKNYVDYLIESGVVSYTTPEEYEAALDNLIKGFERKSNG